MKSLGTANSDDDDDSAMSWVLKSRKKENEKVLAEKRVSFIPVIIQLFFLICPEFVKNFFPVCCVAIKKFSIAMPSITAL